MLIYHASIKFFMYNCNEGIGFYFSYTRFLFHFYALYQKTCFAKDIEYPIVALYFWGRLYVENENKRATKQSVTDIINVRKTNASREIKYSEFYFFNFIYIVTSPVILFQL